MGCTYQTPLTWVALQDYDHSYYFISSWASQWWNYHLDDFLINVVGMLRKPRFYWRPSQSTMPPFWLVSWDGAQIQNIPWQPQCTQWTLRASHLDIAIMQVFSHAISSSSATIILSAFGFPRPEDVDVSDETEVLEKANVIKCEVLCLCHPF